MPERFAKSVVISSSKADAAVSARLREILVEYLGDKVWTREVDLDAGTLIADSIEVQLSDARWLVILYTADAAKSPWVKIEAYSGGLRAIENDDFKITVFRLDPTPLSLTLQAALQNAEIIDLFTSGDFETGFMRLADVIERTESTKSQQMVYVDRGGDSDRVSIQLRQNLILFVLGWAGVGKSAFVGRSIPQLLGKRPLHISLTRGHSIDFLCRDILQRAHVRQPVETPGVPISDAQLLALALDALRLRAPEFFLFLDDGEFGLDPSNRLFPYLETFLEAFVKSGTRTHIVIATSRNPDLPASIGATADVYRLSGLEDVYIAECLDLWLQTSPQHDSLIRDPELREVIKLIGGHPLAAKMVASYLKVKPISQLLLPDESRRFQLKLADHMLRVNDLQTLEEIHHLILMVLSVIKHPATLKDLLSVRLLRDQPLGAIQKALGSLSDWFFLEHDGELLWLHRFVEAYYEDRAAQDQEQLRLIASDFGSYAYARAVELNDQLKAWYPEDVSGKESAVSLSSDVFRYAISAGRLLRSVGDEKRAAQLPIQVRGTLREMVFYFYQQARDYKTALRYAEGWLALNPTDLEVALYQARCYRGLGDGESLGRAEAVLLRIERNDFKKRFWERILREKGLIAQSRGDLDKAKQYFLEGTKTHRAHAYPDNHVGLAQVILHQIDDLPPDDPARLVGAREALKFLEEARQESAVFDRFHLGIYVEALIQSGLEDKAIPLLLDALMDKPQDARLNYRMAEVLRNREDFEGAERHARKAMAAGAEKARLTLANIRYGQAVRRLSLGDQQGADRLLEEGLHAALAFRVEFGPTQEVADSIAAKIYRTMGDWDSARTAMSKYADSTRNSYTVYELGKVDQHDAELAAASGFIGSAIASLDKAIARIAGFRGTHEIPPPLADLLNALEERRASVAAQ